MDLGAHIQPRPARSRRSCLTVPGSSDRMLAKATSLDVDEVILDLEDAVAPAAKEAARTKIVAALSGGSWDSKVRAVRINAVSTPWALRDVIAIIEGAGEHVDVIMVPKVQQVDQVAFIDHTLTQLEHEHGLATGHIGLEIQIEDAHGLASLAHIASASSRIEALVVGPGDMAASLGMPTLTVGDDQAAYPGDPWHFVHSMVLMHARACGIQAIDGPYARIRDADGFRALARRSRALGFDGKWVLHPDQIPLANEIFGVEQVEFERACDILDAYEHAITQQGRGAAMLGDEMIDEATRKMALTNRARGVAQDLTVRATPAEVPFHERGAWRQEHA